MSDLFNDSWKSSGALVESMRLKASQVAAPVNNQFGEMGAESSWIYGMGQSAKYNDRYTQFRGWLYAAINAIAMEGAGQPAKLGILQGADEPQKRAFNRLKQSPLTKKMPSSLAEKSLTEEWELLEGHAFCDVLDNPNQFQTRWQFTYMFLTNLLLTGWGYIVGGETENGFEMFSLPTTWVTPIHRNGPFTEFRILNPNRAAVEQGVILSRDNVAFAHLPNPADPMGALAPADAQITAIRIDDSIQTSQERFFKNGIFPSVVVTVGKDPHPDVPGGGVRPRLSGEQRRQVIGAIRKTMTGVENYGNPAIVDGLIEKIDRLSATSNEMGWDKSEDKIRTRLLSAFGVHPYILGEVVNVGGYAQAAKIEDRFFKKVNSLTEMLGLVTTHFARMVDKRKVFVWWEQLVAVDQGLRYTNLRDARKNGDITKNEWRTELGFAPDESDESAESRAPLLDTVGGMTGYVQIAGTVAQGLLTVEAGATALATFLQIDEALAAAMLQVGVLPQPVLPGPPAPPPAQQQDDDKADLDKAVLALNHAMKLLDATPTAVAQLVDAAAQ